MWRCLERFFGRRVQTRAEHAALPDRLRRRLAVEALRRPGCVRADPAETVAALVAAIDAALSAQMNAVLAHPRMRALERAWRGLAGLAARVPPGAVVQLRVLDMAVGEPGETAALLRRRVLEDVHAERGAAPYAVLVVEDVFDHRHAEQLAAFARIGEACQMPVLAQAGLSLFEGGGIPHHDQIARACDGPEREGWRRLREAPESRYLCLCLPSLLGRLPWGREASPGAGFAFEERGAPCWVNPAHAMAGNIARSVAVHGWATEIRGLEGGGLVDGLPVPRAEGLSPVEAEIDERQEAQLARLGLAAPLRRKGQMALCFFGAQVLAEPPVGDAGASLLTRLPYLLFATRYAQHVMRMAADAPEAEGAAQLQARVQAWFAGQVRADIGQMTREEMARHPLQAAEITVTEGHPRRARLELIPGHRLEGLGQRVVLELCLPARSKPGA
ncbi:type VI secretion system contractile sheath domain-containing protein [Vannielia litorea]|uniref:Type VI secretion system protein ImpC n=1 Tax=Vannielia litorea TaxID=1217970 RepID=A0A1N6GJX8_9RHOB|nr:type VI secretion system contractile sheath large subunit [Vannielia litorea]SIO07702.1 type VI secretion system protein ImpC [Vannielia litorea]